MAIIKCKMCGGDMELTADQRCGTCEYCGSTMTLPKVDNEQRAAAFNRGNHFRRIGEFDNALTVYERIVQEDDSDAEAHWCCALCRFGIEYVKDPARGEYLPTCHRASFDSFLEDADYKAALQHADAVARRQYETDGKKIAQAQKCRKSSKHQKRKITAIVITVLLLSIVSIYLYQHIFTLPSQYRQADSLLKAGHYNDAAAAFASLGDYKDSEDRMLESKYFNAEALLEQGNYGSAAIAFGELDMYTNAKERSMELWHTLIERNSLSCSYNYTVGIKSDGTVIATEYTGSLDDYKGQSDLDSWTDIVAIDCGIDYTVGLKSNGTVVAAGDNSNGQCNVSSWIDIVAVDCGSSHTIGLKLDGTVIMTGDNTYGQCNVDSWTDIIALACGNNHTVGLKADGTVVAAGDNSSGQCDVEDWTDIVAVVCSYYHTVGLKEDGTVVATGKNDDGQCDVDNWTNIASIACGNSHTVGLKEDGTVVAAGENTEGQCNVADWDNIVAVTCCNFHTIGQKSDGTVVAVGRNAEGQCGVEEWDNIVALTGSDFHTVGLKSDGTVVATEYDDAFKLFDYGQCNVTNWTNIRLPNELP